MPFSANQLAIPFALCFITLMAVLYFLHQAQLNRQKQQQAKRLSDLSPPAKERNHRSLPFRQYYLTRQLTAPTEQDELLLKQYSELQRLQAERKAVKRGE